MMKTKGENDWAQVDPQEWFDLFLRLVAEGCELFDEDSMCRVNQATEEVVISGDEFMKVYEYQTLCKAVMDGTRVGRKTFNERVDSGYYDK